MLLRCRALLGDSWCNAGYECYVVGGALRDLLLGQPPKDFDLLTSATPKQAWPLSSLNTPLQTCELVLPCKTQLTSQRTLSSSHLTRSNFWEVMASSLVIGDGYHDLCPCAVCMPVRSSNR